MSQAPTDAIAVSFDREAHASADDHDALRLWLRLLTCTMLIEQEIRARLRAGFAITLARFDLMAQLERSPQGMRMSELSRRLMVTGGNVTGLTDQLVAEGLVERLPVPTDRRAFVVRLTRAGKRAFDRMAAEHERWIVELLGGLTAAERQALHGLLARLKTTVRARIGRQPASTAAPRRRDRAGRGRGGNDAARIRT